MEKRILLASIFGDEDMKIDGQFYLCVGCGKWMPFMGRDVTCDCGYDNDFTEEEFTDLEEAVADVESGEYDY